MPKPSILRFCVSLIVAILSLAAVAPTAQAQGVPNQNQLAVPFGFEVGSTHFEPGKYILSIPKSYTLYIRGESRSAFSMSWHEASLAPAVSSKAVFHRYGDRYFLREVWTKGSSDHLYFPETVMERRVRREASESDHASAKTPTHVEMALLQSPR